MLNFPCISNRFPFEMISNVARVGCLATILCMVESALTGKVFYYLQIFFENKA